MGTLAFFFRVLGIFLSYARLGTSTGYVRAMLFLKIDVHPHTFYQSSGTRHCKTAYDKIPSAKIP